MSNDVLKRRKLPKESSLYPKMSDGVCGAIRRIIKEAIDNINKVAGPFVEAWALEKFEEISDKVGNKYGLVNVEAGKRLDPFDMILQFKLKDVDDYVSANVDAKA